MATREKEEKKSSTRTGHAHRAQCTLSLQLLEGLATIREFQKLKISIEWHDSFSFLFCHIPIVSASCRLGPIWFMGRGQQKMSQWTIDDIFFGVDAPRWYNGGSLFHYGFAVGVSRPFKDSVFANHIYAAALQQQPKNELIEVQRKAKRFMFDNLSVYAASLVSAKY